MRKYKSEDDYQELKETKKRDRRKQRELVHQLKHASFEEEVPQEPVKRWNTNNWSKN